MEAGPQVSRQAVQQAGKGLALAPSSQPRSCPLSGSASASASAAVLRGTERNKGKAKRRPLPGTQPSFSHLQFVYTSCLMPAGRAGLHPADRPASRLAPFRYLSLAVRARALSPSGSFSRGGVKSNL